MDELTDDNKLKTSYLSSSMHGSPRHNNLLIRYITKFIICF